MRNVLSVICLSVILLGCSNQPSTGPSPLPEQATPIATGTPAETPGPTETAGPSTDLSTQSGIKSLSEMLDKQVDEGVLTSQEMSGDYGKMVVWSGAQGVRRIDLEGETENAKFYFQEGKVFQLGGSGTGPNDDGAEVSYTYWAGISDDGTLVGPPFKFVDGKAGPFPEEEVREKESLAKELLKQSGS